MHFVTVKKTVFVKNYSYNIWKKALIDMISFKLSFNIIVPLLIKIVKIYFKTILIINKKVRYFINYEIFLCACYIKKN